MSDLLSLIVLFTIPFHDFMTLCSFCTTCVFESFGSPGVFENLVLGPFVVLVFFEYLVCGDDHYDSN